MLGDELLRLSRAGAGGGVEVREMLKPPYSWPVLRSREQRVRATAADVFPCIREMCVPRTARLRVQSERACCVVVEIPPLSTLP